jgi:hypothetical protein
VPWVKKRRRRKWYRKTNVKAYSVIVLACIVIAAILSFLVERFPVSVDEPVESVSNDMTLELDKSAAPDTAVRVRKPLADTLKDRRQLEQLRKTYTVNKEPDDQELEEIEDLKRKYDDKLDPEELERLKEKYRQSRRLDTRQ